MSDDAVGEVDTDNSKAIAQKFMTSEIWASVIKSGFKWVALVGISFFAYKSVVALSGTTTVADIGVSVRAFASVKVSEVIAWLLTALGIGYGASQKKLRRDVVERLQGRIKMLEKQIDPGRTTSTLTERGETRQGDTL